MKHFERLIFLDRDGTLNPDPGYLSHPAQLSLFPGVARSLADLQTAGFGLVVVTNQSGVGRGLITLENLVAIHARMDELLVHEGGRPMDRYALCTHRPDEGCVCRKPSPYLLRQSADFFGAKLDESFMIGDRSLDLQAGRSAGCRAVVHVRTGQGADEAKRLTEHDADYFAKDLEDAAAWILSR